MRFGTWNIKSMYRAGSFTAAARELARYQLDLAGVQEVRWDKEGTAKAGDYSFISIGCGGMDWIGLAQDRDRWRAIVNAIMNLWV
jgi:exonuclease III